MKECKGEKMGKEAVKIDSESDRKGRRREKLREKVR